MKKVSLSFSVLSKSRCSVCKSGLIVSEYCFKSKTRKPLVCEIKNFDDEVNIPNIYAHKYILPSDITKIDLLSYFLDNKYSTSLHSKNRKDIKKQIAVAFNRFAYLVHCKCNNFKVYLPQEDSNLKTDQKYRRSSKFFNI